MDIYELLSITITRNASDLHLIAGYAPTVRIHGELVPLASFAVLTAVDVEELVFPLLQDKQKDVLIANKELDFSISIPHEQEQIRFRVNAYVQLGKLSASFRLIPAKIQSLEDLRLPISLRELTKLRQGFVLFTGPSGQGKSTSLAALLAEINTNRAVHIITIEDPVEYLFHKGKAIVSQREMYQDTHSWSAALKYALREDPDIVYIGEMRDYETVASALTIAETGHLVLSTLHTNSAAQTIDRIIDIFPPGVKEQVRMQLSMVLSAIITQRLVPSVAGGRVPVCEILLGTYPVKNTIREGKTHLIDNIVQTSGEVGMMLFEEHLRQLVTQNIISHETALEYALKPERYLQLIQR